MEIYHKYSPTDTQGYFKIAVEAPNSANKPYINKVFEVQKVMTDPNVQGSFKISVGSTTVNTAGTPIDVPFNTNAIQLASWMSNSLGYEVRVDTIARTDGGSTWIISFVGATGTNVILISLDTTLLTGGSMNVTSLVDGSNSMRVAPVSSEFLMAPTSSASVIVDVNGVGAQCLGNSSFTVIPVAYLKTAVLSGSTVSLNMMVPSIVGNTPSVLIGIQPCSFLSGGNSSYKCSLPTNGDNSVQL